MKQTPVQATGMVWYLPEDFAEIKAMMVDGHVLHATHAKWQSAAENGERTLSAQGVRIYRAILRPADFKAWCERNNLKPDASARNKFASEFAYREVQAGR